ncbi:unnamed protein product [Effrenium voratum]|uniref:Uncharacterized protein n=1 Tax=Effrenium voratum TaxID=2562239 RepID=A0AA36J7A0_9DINO|nr:unnamed protein product [Effrenium voratum]CAJ1456840.1 unnamed protein product [Effrenium voratum]
MASGNGCECFDWIFRRRIEEAPVPARQAPSPVARPRAFSDNPVLYAPLVMAVGRVRLNVPVKPLQEKTFSMEICGMAGVPLLKVDLREERLEISLHSVGTLLAIVTSAKQVMGLLEEEPWVLGTLVKEADGERHALRDESGRMLLEITSQEGEHKMTCDSEGETLERGTAVWRAPTDRVPLEHFEVTAQPNVDGVLLVACFLAVTIF